MNNKWINKQCNTCIGIFSSRCDMIILQHADVAAVVMQEGLAHICLITSSMTLVRAKIDQCIPRKRKGNVQQHEKVSGSHGVFS